MTNVYNRTSHIVIRILPIVAALFLISCSASRQGFDPQHKYSPTELHYDYSIFRGALEESHPGIYWYTSKEQMDAYFNWGAAQLWDSLNEEQFRRVLTYVIARINCGHTVVRTSRQFLRYRDTTRTKFFPLLLKFWPDTAVVTANMNLNDKLVKRGTIINRIDGVPVSKLLDTFFRYVSSDGYNITHKYQALSNRGSFGSSYTALFGTKNSYLIDFTDSAGRNMSARIPAYDIRPDTASRSNRTANIPPRPDRSTRRRMVREGSRNLVIDSANIATMTINSFGRSLRLKGFMRKSFKKLKNEGVQHLIIDVRANGGGSVTNSTMLTKYVADKKFKIADSLYTNTRNSKYKKHIGGYFFNQLFMFFMTRKKPDGKYHFGYFERHFFKPKRRNHFDGKVYVLTGGNSFSATTLFAQTVRPQENVVIVGEETGGGAYGNSAWLIPDAELPITRVRFRLPLFRLVINKNIPKDGRGVLPEVESFPTVEAIRNAVDFKMNKAVELIRTNNQYSPIP